MYVGIEIKGEKKYLDEIWRLIGVTSNKEVASFIYKIFKTIRKYGGSRSSNNTRCIRLI